MIRTVLALPRSAARSRLRAWLLGQPDIRLVGDTASGTAALRLILKSGPDLAFLHPELARMSGFQVAEALAPDPKTRPVIVIVAPDARHALRAFGIHALDYLQAPLDAARLDRTLARVRQTLRRRRPVAADAAPLSETSGPRLALRLADRLAFVPLDDLLWVRAVRRRCELHLRNQVVQARIALGTLARRLPASQFSRINRSMIVRHDFIRELRGKSHGDRWVVLNDGTAGVLTRGRRRQVLRNL